MNFDKKKLVIAASIVATVLVVGATTYAIYWHSGSEVATSPAKPVQLMNEPVDPAQLAGPSSSSPEQGVHSAASGAEQGDHSAASGAEQGGQSDASGAEQGGQSDASGAEQGGQSDASGAEQGIEGGQSNETAKAPTIGKVLKQKHAYDQSKNLSLEELKLTKGDNGELHATGKVGIADDQKGLVQIHYGIYKEGGSEEPNWVDSDVSENGSFDITLADDAKILKFVIKNTRDGVVYYGKADADKDFEFEIVDETD